MAAHTIISTTTLSLAFESIRRFRDYSANEIIQPYALQLQVSQVEEVSEENICHRLEGSGTLGDAVLRQRQFSQKQRSHRHYADHARGFWHNKTDESNQHNGTKLQRLEAPISLSL
jgi:hypothetical protein